MTRSFLHVDGARLGAVAAGLAHPEDAVNELRRLITYLVHFEVQPVEPRLPQT